MKTFLCILMFAGLAGAPLFAQSRGGSSTPNTPEAQAEKSGKSVSIALTDEKAVVTVGVKSEYTDYTINMDSDGHFKEEDLAKLPQWTRDLVEKRLKALQEAMHKSDSK